MNQVKSILAVTIMGLLALLPLRWAQAFGRWLGRRFYRKGNKLARNTARNLELCFPEKSAQERERLTEESMTHTGMVMAEMGMSWLWPVPRALRKVRAVHNEHLVQDALESGQGAILLAPHIGNWEMLNLYVSNRYPITVMYKPPKLKLLDKLIRKMRARLGSDMAPASPQGVRKVIKCLRKGGMTGILPDQEPDLSGGVFAPFFGIEANTMKLVPQLAAQTGARVIMGYARRLPDAQGFDIYFAEASPGMNEKDLEVSAQAMNASVEACVRALPEQYQWEYRRFNTRPEGEAALY